MTTEQTLLHAIKQNPDEDGLRLVLADWLEENGQAERAEFIRVQLEVAALPWTDPRRHELERRGRELESQNAARWQPPGVRFVSYQRGLLCLYVEQPEELSQLDQFSDEDWLWIERMVASGNGIAEALTASAHLARLTSLSLTGLTLGDAAGAAALAASPHLAGLTELRLRNSHIGAAGAAALAGSPHVTGLTTLDLAYNRIGAAGVKALAASSHFARLTHLDLCGNRIRAAGTTKLAASPHLAQLTHLDLSCNGIGSAGAAVLAASPRLRRLASLVLTDNGIDDEGAAALAASHHLDRLTSLTVGGNHIGDAGLAELRKRFGAGVTWKSTEDEWHMMDGRAPLWDDADYPSITVQSANQLRTLLNEYKMRQPGFYMLASPSGWTMYIGLGGPFGGLFLGPNEKKYAYARSRIVKVLIQRFRGEWEKEDGASASDEA